MKINNIYIPDRVLECMKNRIISPISWHGATLLLGKDELIEEQQGYGYYDKEAQEHIEGWLGTHYIVIGYDNANPIIAKIDEVDIPIFYALHGQGHWNDIIKISDNFENYIATIKLIEKEFDNEDWNYEKANALLKQVKELNPTSMEYWEMILDAD